MVHKWLGATLLAMLLVPSSSGLFMHTYDGEWPDQKLRITDMGTPGEFWVNWTTQLLQGGTYNGTVQMVWNGESYGANMSHPAVNEWLHRVTPQDGALVWDISPLWGQTVYHLSFNDTTTATIDHHNPFNAAFGPVARPEGAPRVQGEGAMPFSAWSTFEDGFITNTIEVESLQLGACTHQQLEVNLVPAAGGSQVWGSLFMRDNELNLLDILIPDSEAGFIAVSDAELNRIDITKNITIMEGSPGRVQWVLDGIDWHDGYKGPSLVEARVQCDDVESYAMEANVYQPERTGWLMLIGIFMVLFVVILLLALAKIRR